MEDSIAQGIEAKHLADRYAYCRQIANCYNIVAGMVGICTHPLESLVHQRSGLAWNRGNCPGTNELLQYAVCPGIEGEILILLSENASKVGLFWHKNLSFIPWVR